MAHSTTRVLHVDAAEPAAEPIAEAAAVLRRGGLVAFPTETVYGLGANAFDAEAVARIYAAKGRPASNPLIVHLATGADLPQVAVDVPPLAYELATRFWPGALTLVLPRHQQVPPSVAAGGLSVAVRVPSHPVAQALIAAAGVPVAAPSANSFTRPSPTSAAHVLEDLDGRIEVVLDGGATPIGVESTVLSLLGTVPEILRPGGVPIELLRDLVPELRYEPRYLAMEDGAAPSPGMLLRHYSPRATVLLFDGLPAAALAAMRHEAASQIRAGQRVGVLVPNEDQAHFDGLAVAVAVLGPRDDHAQIAAHLFDGLRALDRAGADVILVRSVGRGGLALAIWDRLLRATEGRVISV